METKRIAYIDAMRGFTMILVVYSHILHFCYGDSTMGFNTVLFLFRLPCFFFISGWLFDKAVWSAIPHKFMVQIVPTFTFLLLLAPPPEFFHQLGALKGGYWFTFVLFEFFLIQIVASRCGRWGILVALAVSVGSFWFGACQHRLRMMSSGSDALSVVLDICGFLSIAPWRYYLFFFIGSWVRLHFETFIRLTDKPLVIAAVTIGFFAIASTDHPASPVLEYLRFSLGGILGMIMVFTCFRLLSPYLQTTAFFHSLQYVGTRTLDIYLLHYFFLPRFLMDYGDQLRAYGSPLLEFLAAMVPALVVLVLSLLLSWLIRLSPFLGHYLFGVKYERQRQR